MRSGGQRANMTDIRSPYGQPVLPTRLLQRTLSAQLRQWYHAHAEKGFLASQSPAQHVMLTPKFDQQLLANFCLGFWPPGNRSKTGDRPAGAESAEHGPAAELKMRRGWRLEGPQTWSEGCVLPALADLPRLAHGPKEPNPLPLSF